MDTRKISAFPDGFADEIQEGTGSFLSRYKCEICFHSPQTPHSPDEQSSCGLGLLVQVLILAFLFRTYTSFSIFIFGVSLADLDLSRILRELF